MRRILLVILLGLVAVGVVAAEEKPLVQPSMEWSAAKDAAFVVAYVYGEPTDAERRPPDKTDPFDNKAERTPLGILQSGKLDVAALAGLTRERARLNDTQRKELFAAVFRSTKVSPIMECYEPHHAFVFYDKDGAALGVIEVCLHCNRVKLTQQENLIFAVTGRCDEPVDFLAIAQLLKQLGLSMPGYASFEEYEKNFRNQEKAVRERMKEREVKK